MEHTNKVIEEIQEIGVSKHPSVQKLLDKRAQLERESQSQIEKLDQAISSIEGLLLNAKGASFIQEAIEAIVKNCMDEDLISVKNNPKSHIELLKLPLSKSFKKDKPKTKKSLTPKSKKNDSVPVKQTKQDLVMIAVAEILNDGVMRPSGEIMKELNKRQINLSAPNLSGYLSKLGKKYKLKNKGRAGWFKI